MVNKDVRAEPECCARLNEPVEGGYVGESLKNPPLGEGKLLLPYLYQESRSQLGAI